MMVEKPQTEGGAPGQGRPPFPPLPGIPPGVDPVTYRIETVSQMLRRAAYISLFSMPDPSQSNRPIIDPFWGLVGVEVHERLHRFDVMTDAPDACRGLRACNQVGQPEARVHIHWRPIPEGFVAAPDRLPPPTPLNPFCSQRFGMYNGHFEFDDGSGFHGFGTGRTFPALIGGQPQLRISAVVDILEGFGRLKGFAGTVVVNGYIVPPEGLALNVMIRLLDPQSRLLGESALPPIQPLPDPDPGTTFLNFLGETDPQRPTRLIHGPDGRMTGSIVHERLRLVHLGSALEAEGIRSKARTGAIVANLSGQLYFNPFQGQAGSPIPFQTRNGVFTFFDRHCHPVGTLYSNIVEGRAFPAQLPGAPMPVFRFGGFGPFLKGEGIFEGVPGVMSLNAAISVFPRTLSNLYVLRVSDPEGAFARRCSQAWGGSF